MIDKPTYQYNCKRQAAITQELTEIVGARVCFKGGMNEENTGRITQIIERS